MNHNSLAAFHEAENSIMSKSELVLSALTLNGPMCYEQLAAATGILTQSISGVVGRLRDRKLIMQTGTRRTTSGCNAAVWDHTEPYLRKEDT